VLIGLAAGRTSRIRLGSGGVMLPNHSPFVVAEQFATLEAAAPGRIDLGLGRAPGSDPVITALLRSSGPTSDPEQFPSHVADILTLLHPDGAALRLGEREYTVRATPAPAGVPDIWLLGSSDFSAELAAKLGLPYVFAHHFSGEGTERALDLYRSGFRPSAYLDAPRTFLTVNAVVADTRAEAAALAQPNLRSMARLRTGGELRPLETVEQVAAAGEPTPAEQHVMDAMSGRWIIDDAEGAARAIRSLAARFEVDEVMIAPVAGARESDPPGRTPARERTLELLASRLRVPA
jgi:luciferase family oxidoreductase group 1